MSFQATREVEIGRTVVPARLGKKVCKTPSQWEKSWACYPSYFGKYKMGLSWSRLAGQEMRPYLQNNQSKKGWRHGSSSRCLPSKPRVLSSKPSTYTHTHTHTHTKYKRKHYKAFLRYEKFKPS
jgi:hypothetical protein